VRVAGKGRKTVNTTGEGVLKTPTCKRGGGRKNEAQHLPEGDFFRPPEKDPREKGVRKQRVKE